MTLDPKIRNSETLAEMIMAPKPSAEEIAEDLSLLSSHPRGREMIDDMLSTEVADEILNTAPALPNDGRDPKYPIELPCSVRIECPDGVVNAETSHIVRTDGVPLINVIRAVISMESDINEVPPPGRSGIARVFLTCLDEGVAKYFVADAILAPSVEYHGKPVVTVPHVVVNEEVEELPCWVKISCPDGSAASADVKRMDGEPLPAVKELTITIKPGEIAQVEMVVYDNGADTRVLVADCKF